MKKGVVYSHLKLHIIKQDKECLNSVDKSHLEREHSL